MKLKNNWYVITGTPCSGKTTLLRFLKEKGYKTVDEAARTYIDQGLKKGKSIEQIRGNELFFQEKVLELKIKIEQNLPKDEIIFFDRGIPDSEAFYKMSGALSSIALKNLREAINNCSYKKVFLLDFFDYKKDYARTETKEQQIQIHNLLKESYKKIDTPIIEVPKMRTKADRLTFILNNLRL